MRASAGTIGTGLVCWLAAAAVASAQQPAAVPDATFQGAAGKVSLKDYRGKQSVVLLFMRGFSDGRACYYCGEQTREYASHHAEFVAAGAEVLMVIPLGNDIAGYVRKIGEDSNPPDASMKLPFPVVLDADGSACKAFQVPIKKPGPYDPFPVASPATIVIGKDGRILFEHHGTEPGDRPEAVKVLALLRGAPAAATAPKSAAAPPARTWSAYEAGMAAAKAQRRPILLEFHAVW